jgi:SAM-dependent methyltransferase
MATHQSLSDSSDEDLLGRMIATHPERFGPNFWAFFAAHVGNRLPPRPVMMDLGCGPGLFLRDLAERYPQATLHGYDVTPAMVAHARQLSYGTARATLALHDVATQPLPLAAASVDLTTMSSVLHVFDEPLRTLAEIRRVLAPGGLFVLHDWIRQPLQAYLAYRRDVLKEDPTESLRRGFRLFPVHNKYTPEDWRWFLAEAGFKILDQGQLRASHRLFVTTPTAAADQARNAFTAVTRAGVPPKR